MLVEPCFNNTATTYARNLPPYIYLTRRFLSRPQMIFGRINLLLTNVTQQNESSFAKNKTIFLTNTAIVQ